MSPDPTYPTYPTGVRPDHPTGDPKRNPTDIQTDERTQTPTANLSHSLSATRTHVQGFDADGDVKGTTLADLLARYPIDKEPRRYPTVRRGERDLIPPLVRWSIYRRDGLTCRECGWGSDNGEGLELDHMLPWSAGGSDTSDNLRTLCSPCNQRRSNWDDGMDASNLRPTTWWCYDCWHAPHLDPQPGDEDLDVDPNQPEPRRWRRIWRNGIDLNRVPYILEPTVQVYCAWCWGYGFTDQAFIGEQQTKLVNLCAPLPAEDEW